MFNIKKYLGSFKIKDITLYRYQNFLNSYAITLKKSSLLLVNCYAKMLFKHAVKYGVILNNPTIDAVIPKKQEKLVDITSLYLTKEEVHELIRYLKYYYEKRNKPIYQIAMLMVYTGMRVGEVCALTWQDVDFVNNKINIRSTMFGQSCDNYIRQDTPKTKSSVREILIDDVLTDILKDWKHKQLEIRLKNGTMNRRDKDDYVFTRYSYAKDYEYPFFQESITVFFNYKNKKHIFSKKIHPHMLRHTHASLLAEAGVSLETIQERLGHANDTITRQVYLHVTEKQKENAAKVFSEYMKEL